MSDMFSCSNFIIAIGSKLVDSKSNESIWILNYTRMYYHIWPNISIIHTLIHYTYDGISLCTQSKSFNITTNMIIWWPICNRWKHVYRSVWQHTARDRFPYLGILSEREQFELMNQFHFWRNFAQWCAVLYVEFWIDFLHFQSAFESGYE